MAARYDSRPSISRRCAAAAMREKREVARAIDAACRDTGFFLVTGHGVAADLIQSRRASAPSTSSRCPTTEKMKVQRPPAKISRGYNWVGDRSIAYSMGQAAPPDIQEAFAFGHDRADLAAKVDKASAQMYAPNIWPEQPDDFKDDHGDLLRRHDGARVRACCAPWRSRSASTRIISPTSSTARPACCRIIRYPAVKETAAAGPASRRHPHRLRHHDLRARRRHAGRPAGQASQRRLDRRPHPAERLRLQHRRPDDALVERPLGVDPASRRACRRRMQRRRTASRWCSSPIPIRMRHRAARGNAWSRARRRNIRRSRCRSTISAS